MAQWLSVLTALPEDPGLLPSKWLSNRETMSWNNQDKAKPKKEEK